MKKSSYFNTLQLIFMALMLAQVTMLFVAVYLVQMKIIDLDETKTLAYVAIVLGLIALLGEGLLRDRIYATAAQEKDLAQKKKKYTIALIINLSILEAATVLCIIAYAYSGDILVMGVILLLLFISGSKKPGPEKFKQDLQLTDEDIRQIDNV